MLYIASKFREISFRKLMQLYEVSNLEKAVCEYGDVCKESALGFVEDEFYAYLEDCFFRTPGAAYYILEREGTYVSALRLEPYRDGLLVSALETHPKYRMQGYASQLMEEVIRIVSVPLYSHVAKENWASLAVHDKCGFIRISEMARYLDGSVDGRCYTLRFRK